MTKILRKTISIKHNNDFVYCLTYNLEENIIVKNLQYWVKENLQDNFTYLYRIQQLNIGLKANSKEHILEKTLFEQLKRVDTFVLGFENFNTQKASDVKKPHLNFVLLNEKEIDEKIENYIKGE